MSINSPGKIGWKLDVCVKTQKRCQKCSKQPKTEGLLRWALSRLRMGLCAVFAVAAANWAQGASQQVSAVFSLRAYVVCPSKRCQ